MNTRQIRLMFPDPVKSIDGDGHGYCVGGAYLLAHGMKDIHFPRAIALAYHMSLFECKQVFDIDTATLTTLNDAGDFEGAWSILEKLIG